MVRNIFIETITITIISVKNYKYCHIIPTLLISYILIGCFEDFILR